MRIWDIIRKLNDAIAIRLTLTVGTMGCFYAFVLLSLLPLLIPSERDVILYVSNCFQLAFLPLIMVGQWALGRKTERRAEADHRAIMEQLRHMRQLRVDLLSGKGCTRTRVKADK